MKKAVIAALSICCLMGVVTASAAEVQVKTEKTVSAAVDAADEAQKEGPTQKQYVPAKSGEHHEGSLKDRVQKILGAKESAPAVNLAGDEKYHYAESTHEATVITPWNRQKYEDQYQYQYQHDSYDAAIANAYAYRRDFGKSNLRKWSSTEGMDTPWDSNRTTDTVHFQSSTIAFLDRLNAEARQAGISFIITGGAEGGYHASGLYSHENGYKVDISDDGIYQGSKAYEVLLNALAPYKHQITHEWDKNHFDITIIRKITAGKASFSTEKGRPSVVRKTVCKGSLFFMSLIVWTEAIF